jgi:hypothetical protein
MKAKGNKTWRDVISDLIPTDPDEMLKKTVYEKFGELKALAGSCGRRDIFDFLEVLRVITLRCIKEGVDKDKVSERIDALLEVVWMWGGELQYSEIDDDEIMLKRAREALEDLKKIWGVGEKEKKN